MLERKYASQLSKPEVQLNLTSNNAVTNNTLVITAERAEGLRSRNASIEQALSKLTPPGRSSTRETLLGQVSDKSGLATEGGERINNAGPGDPNNNQSANKTSTDSVVTNDGPPTAPTGTPDVGGGVVEATPHQNLKF
jgi:hypothetical protein